MNNLIVGENLHDETKLYRIMTLPAFLNLMEVDKLDLRRICEWDDPYEVWTKSWFPEKDWSEKRDTYNFYGFCMTRCIDSDALWRIYSPDKQGICISTTVGRIKSFLQQIDMPIECCIADIIYNPLEAEKFILGKIYGQNTVGNKLNQFGPFLQALIKRKAFIHEQETRLIIWDKENNNTEPLNHNQKSFLSIKNNNAIHLIDEIILDPSAEAWYVNLLQDLCSKHHIKVSKSNLYTPEYDRLKISVQVTRRKYIN